jgi:UrcA family protein
MTINRIIASALSAAVVLGVAAAPAIARDQPSAVVTATNPDDVVTREVAYADLNLASAIGEQALIRRVQHVVSDVCLDAVGGTLGYMKQTITCKDNSWQGASPQIDRAVQRARDIAANGWSAIAPVAIRISIQ